MRKVLAAIAGVLLLWTSSVLAPSASAHDEHANWFKWREPEDNSDVSGEKVVLRAKVQFEEGVSRWAVEILPPDGYATMTSWGVVCESLDKDKRSNTVEISCEWNSANYPDGKPSRNHAYRARVMAWNEASERQQPDSSGSGAGEGGGSGEGSGESGGGSGSGSKSDESTTSSSSSSSSTSTSTSSTSTTSSTTTTTTKQNAGTSEKHLSPVRTLVVANPPAAPDGVRLDYQKNASEVTVSWEPNSEPDISHYIVEERFDDGEWSLVAKTTDTSWKGRLDEKGTYRYRVAAARYVGSSQRIKEGPRRQPQSGLRQVEADPGKDTTDSTRPPEANSAEGKRKDQEEDKKKGEGEAGPEATTSSTAPPESVIVNYGGGGDPAATSTTGAAGAAVAAPSGLSSIEPGSPGSVQTRYADPPRLPAPVAPEQAYDPGFSLALPYPKEVRLDIGPPPEPEPRLLGTVVLFDSNEEQRRALVGVLAGALVVFMVSMQAAYLNRRPRPIDLAASTDWD